MRAGLKHIKWSAIGSRETGLTQTCWGLIHWHVSGVWGKFEQSDPCSSEISLLLQQGVLLADNSGSLSFLTPEILIFWRNIFCLADLPKLRNSFRSCRFPDPLGKVFCL